jgi:hypothetical protein
MLHLKLDAPHQLLRQTEVSVVAGYTHFREAVVRLVEMVQGVDSILTNMGSARGFCQVVLEEVVATPVELSAAATAAPGAVISYSPSAHRRTPPAVTLVEFLTAQEGAEETLHLAREAMGVMVKVLPGNPTRAAMQPALELVVEVGAATIQGEMALLGLLELYIGVLTNGTFTTLYRNINSQYNRIVFNFWGFDASI